VLRRLLLPLRRWRRRRLGGQPRYATIYTDIMGRRVARTVLRQRRRRVRPADRRRRGPCVVMVDCAGHQPGDAT